MLKTRVKSEGLDEALVQIEQLKLKTKKVKKEQQKEQKHLKEPTNPSLFDESTPE